MCQVGCAFGGGDDLVFVVIIDVACVKCVGSCCCYVALEYGDLGSLEMMLWLGRVGVPCG